MTVLRLNEDSPFRLWDVPSWMNTSAVSGTRRSGADSVDDNVAPRGAVQCLWYWHGILPEEGMVGRSWVPGHDLHWDHIRSTFL